MTERLVVDMSKKIHEQITPETWNHTGDVGGVEYSKCIWLWCTERYAFSWGATLTKVLDYFQTKNLMEIYRWNDAPERTFDDVLTVLKELDL